MKDPKKNTGNHNESDRSKSGASSSKPIPNPKTGAPNPPRTTTGKWTAPKFGSAGSGGAELEPGPEKD